MDAFDYVNVLISVVIGLGITHLLTAATSLIGAWRRVRFSGLWAGWVALTFVGMVYLWWSIWNLRGIRSWNFFTFLVLLLQPVTLFIAAAFLVPSEWEREGPLELAATFAAARRPFFITLATTSLTIWVYNSLLAGRPATGVGAAFLWLLLALEVAAAFVRAVAFQWAVMLLFAALFAGFVARYAAVLR